MLQAIEDKREEPAFFRALLDSAVYAHAPLSDDSPHVRFIQFVRPDGLTVLPFFTDEAKAQFAARSAARIVVMTGRQLMALTRGATLMLNPNDTNCTLYPEEIEALLATGAVATVEQVELDEREVWIGPPQSSPAWLVAMLTELFQRLSCVETAYLVEMRSPEDLARATLVIAVGVPPADSERIARAATTKIQPRCKGLDFGIDLTTFDPLKGPPQWLQDSNAERFYPRSEVH